MAFSVVSLADRQGRSDIETKLREGQSNTRIVPHIMDRLDGLGVRSAIVEQDYIDRDFSEAYYAYYARTFLRHTKRCTRILFFSDDVSFLTVERDIAAAATRLQGLSGSFLGWIVLRPVSGAPVGQVILAMPPAPAGHEGHLLVKARYTAHVLGAELSVDTIPMTQQDSRIGSCAQASLWVSSRHFHAKHRGAWMSTVDLTRAATASADSSINRALPAGSEFLTMNNIVSAFREAGRESLIYARGSDPFGNPIWGPLDPAAVINRYVDSGIPVFLGLAFAGQGIGHAVVAAGHMMKAVPHGALPPNPTRAEFCEAFYVNDDQIGSLVVMPTRPGSPIDQAGYNVQENVSFVVVPLPSSVYVKAESAEAAAWDALRQYAATWDATKLRFAGKFGASEALGDAFVDDIRQNTVVARTYLTYGWKYAHRTIRNRLPDSFKAIVQSLALPRYVYVTEFSNLGDSSHASKLDRRVRAHVVVDATAKRHDFGAVLVFQAPGHVIWHAHDEKTLRRRATALRDCEPYYPKIRGQMDFVDFARNHP